MTMLLIASLLVSLTRLSHCVWNEDLHMKWRTKPRTEFIEYFNKQNYSWTMAENDWINDRFLDCAHIGLNYKTNYPIMVHDPATHKDLPVSFDARVQWYVCESIQVIYNQDGLNQSCGSCWTFGTATTASDRTCIHTNKQVQLSEEDFECMQTNVCGGGVPMEAFQYWQTNGLVTEACKPYDIAELKQNVCKKHCANGKDYEEDKHFGGHVYSVDSDIDNIKAELVKNGPIQAGFAVYEDFIHYNTGVYVHTHGSYRGRHSVRVIGYGVENKMNYWLVANSWGEAFGDHGFFKIQQGQPDIHFEDEMCTGIPK